MDSILRQQRRKEVQGVERIRSTPADLSEMKHAARSVGIANRNTRYPDLHKIALTIYSATYILGKPCLSVPPSCSSGKPRRLARGPIAKAVARLIGFD